MAQGEFHIDGEDFKMEAARFDPVKLKLGELVKIIVQGTAVMATGLTVKCCEGENNSAENEAKINALQTTLKKCYAELDRREEQYKQMY